MANHTQTGTRKRKSPDQVGERDNPTSSKRVKRTEKAPDSIPWEVFYMSVAELEAQRSNCLENEKVTHAGDNKINNIRYTRLLILLQCADLYACSHLSS